MIYIKILSKPSTATLSCHCGLRDYWNSNVSKNRNVHISLLRYLGLFFIKIGINRLCDSHKKMLKCQIQNKCQYIDLKGMRIPISPDGIPMVNLARPIQSFQETDETLKNYFWKIQKTRNLDSHAVGLVVAWPYGLVIDFMRNPIHGSAVWFFVIVSASSILPCDSLLLLQKGSNSSVTQLF